MTQKQTNSISEIKSDISPITHKAYSLFKLKNRPRIYLITEQNDKNQHWDIFFVSVGERIHLGHTSTQNEAHQFITTFVNTAPYRRIGETARKLSDKYLKTQITTPLLHTK